MSAKAVPADAARTDTLASEGVTPHGSKRSEFPLGGYAALMGAYLGFIATLLELARRRGRLPERLGMDDVLLMAAATQRLSRLITKDRVTTVLRAPFTEYQGRGGPGEVEEAARGRGLRRAIGELLVCPFCVAQWLATALAAGLLFAPRVTRVLAGILAAVGFSDLLQFAYKGTERAALD